MSPRSHLLTLFVLVALGAVAAHVAWTVPITSPGKDQGRGDNILESLGKPMDGRFRLIDHLGRKVGPDTFTGKVRLVFFGFNHCPDACPTGLSLVSQLLEELGPDAKDVQALFVTVDPERDTVHVLKEYVSVFGGDILGLTGTPQQIEAVTKAFNAYFKKVPRPSGGYTVDHTASVYVLNRDGSFRATIDIHEPQNVSLQKVRRILKPRSRSQNAVA
jgi:protein SCO1/2